jgi:hypothetical protein
MAYRRKEIVERRQQSMSELEGDDMTAMEKDDGTIKGGMSMLLIAALDIENRTASSVSQQRKKLQEEGSSPQTRIVPCAQRMEMICSFALWMLTFPTNSCHRVNMAVSVEDGDVSVWI